MYVKELTVRYRRRRVAGPPSSPARLSTPLEAAAVLVPILRHEIVEVCGIVCLSVHHDILAYHEMSRGTLDTAIVHPRDVFRTALLTNAAAVIVAHNHPSGDPTPSPNDIVLTQRLQAGARVLGLEISDHLIVAADGRYFSFREGIRLAGSGV